jgi:molybdopterin/thiamine biosynthesis adenylyltransferase
MTNSKPQFFDRSVKAEGHALDELVASGKVFKTIDHYVSQLEELYAVENPTKVFTPDFKKERDAHIASLGDLNVHGKWVYFPWSGSLVHLLEDELFQKVRFGRNRNLISEKEQLQFYNFSVGIAGLSVGNSIAVTLALQGGSRRIKLADGDRFELSNLNRIRASVDNLGLRKTEIAQRQILEINPYAEVHLFSEISDENLADFLSGIDCVVDEIDSFPMKYKIREMASKNRLPVVSAADSDRSGVLMVERYDLDATQEYFNSALAGVTLDQLSNASKIEVGRYITMILGTDAVSERMMSSLDEMGVSIVSWPQLGGTATLNGAVVTNCLYKLATGMPSPSGRHIYHLD